MRTDSMRVLEITHDYYNTKIYSKLFEKLDKQLEYCVAIPVDRCSEEKDFQINDINYYNIKGNQKRRFGLLSNAKRCAEIISEKINLSSIDLIHAHYLSDAVIAYYIYKKHQIPYITSLRGTCCNEFIVNKKWYRRILASIVLNKASAWEFLSPSAKELTIRSLFSRHMEQAEKKALVIPNGIDDFWHENESGKNKQFDTRGTIRIITVASINSNKNQTTVAKAIDSLIQKGFSIEYVIVGNVQDQSVFSELKSYDFVNYEGEKNKEQLLLEYRKADIFALLSFSETFGLVYAEALSQGLPIVYTRGQGFDGQVENGTVGLHTSPADEREIERAITFVITHYEEMAGNCTTASNYFDWSNIAQEHVDVYRRVLKET